MTSSDVRRPGSARVLPETGTAVANARWGTDVISHGMVDLIASDTVVIASTTSITGSLTDARVGDVLWITSGALDKTQVSVIEVIGATLTLGQTLPSTPAGGVTYDILRFRPALLARVMTSTPAGTEEGVVTRPIIGSLPLPTGAATEAKQDTIIGHIDGIEGILATIDADTGSMATSLSNIDTDATTIIGHVDGIEGALTTLNAKDFATQTTLAAVLARQSDKTQFTKLTDGTDTVEVENAATYSTSIPYTTKGATVNSRAQQIWDPNHPDNDGSGADEAFYGQNQDSNGNLCSNLSSVRGKLLRYRNQVGVTASGTNPPPLWIGGAAATVTPSSCTAGRAVDGYWSKSGHLVVNIDSVREQNGDQLTTLTSTTTVTAIVTADATYMNDLIGLVITNTSATATDVILYDDDGTTERTHIYCPAADTRGVVFARPFKQTAINKAWKAKTVTGVASVYITAQFSKQL